MKRLPALLVIAFLTVSCNHPVPVKQAMASVADTITAVGNEVLLVQKTTHTAAITACPAAPAPRPLCPLALATDAKVQAAAVAYANAADVVLAKVKLTASSLDTLAAYAPLVAKAQAVYDAFSGASFSAAVDAELSKLHALLLSLQ
jgi:hypothetical protein